MRRPQKWCHRDSRRDHGPSLRKVGPVQPREAVKDGEGLGCADWVATAPEKNSNANASAGIGARFRSLEVQHRCCTEFVMTALQKIALFDRICFPGFGSFSSTDARSHGQRAFGGSRPDDHTGGGRWIGSCHSLMFRMGRRQNEGRSARDLFHGSCPNYAQSDETVRVGQQRPGATQRVRRWCCAQR